jgi:hypothetical protein
MQNAVMLAAAVVALNYKFIHFEGKGGGAWLNTSAADIIGSVLTRVMEGKVHLYSSSPYVAPTGSYNENDEMIRFGESKPSVHDPGHNKDELDKVRHINKNIDGNTGI